MADLAEKPERTPLKRKQVNFCTHFDDRTPVGKPAGVFFTKKVLIAVTNTIFLRLTDEHPDKIEQVYFLSQPVNELSYDQLTQLFANHPEQFTLLWEKQ